MAAVTLSELITMTLSLDKIQTLISGINIKIDNYLYYLNMAEIDDLRIYSYEDYCEKIDDILEILRYYMPDHEFTAITQYKSFIDELVLDVFKSVS